MATIINAVTGTGLTQTADASGIIKIQSNSVTTNALAWVNFNGTGTVAINASYNVSSITDNGTGDYTVNFTTALTNANYAACISGSAGSGSGFTGQQNANLHPTVAQTSSACRVVTSNTISASYIDYLTVTVSVFGN
jgi:hypothetical protein